MSDRLLALCAIALAAAGCRPSVACVETRSGHTVAIASIDQRDSTDAAARLVAASAAQHLAEATCDHPAFQLVDHDQARRARKGGRMPALQTLMVGHVSRAGAGESLVVRAVDLETSVVRFSLGAVIDSAGADSATRAFGKAFIDSLATRVPNPGRGIE